MKPLPDLEDTAAMLLRGKRSALAAARGETLAALRDAYTALDACEWTALPSRVADVRACVDRLETISAWWERVNA